MHNGLYKAGKNAAQNVYFLCILNANFIGMVLKQNPKKFYAEMK